MKIVPIFAGKLFSIHYESEEKNEYHRLMALWKDMDFLYNYALDNRIGDIDEFVEQIQADRDYIQDLMSEMRRSKRTFESFFKRLNDLESGTKFLSLRKGSRYKLRIYAIRIDSELFLITGGAIKLLWKMQDHPDTQKELLKLNQIKDYLKRNGVFDADSFYELINEDDENE